MFKKTMTFDDLEGEEVTQTFYFNYKKSEIAELLQFGCLLDYMDPEKTYIPLEEMLERLNTPTEESGLTEQENTKQAYESFRSLILDAYGIKEADNVRFTKNPELREQWRNHVAFEEMIWEFVGDPALAATFVESCLPPKAVSAVKADMQKEAQKNGGAKLSSTTLSEMVEEAARRQENEETRIEPGLEAAREALGENPVVEKLALSVVKDSNELTEEDILTMPKEQFDALNMQELSKTQMLAAFKRKSQG